MIKNFIAIVVIVISVGVFIYTWKTKVSDFEIDYAKITFQGEDSPGVTKEKGVTDCISEAVKDAQLTGRTRAEEKHYNFYCRCVKKNVVDEEDMKDVIAVRQNCLNWTEKFFDQPNLFSK